MSNQSALSTRRLTNPMKLPSWGTSARFVAAVVVSIAFTHHEMAQAREDQVTLGGLLKGLTGSTAEASNDSAQASGQSAAAASPMSMTTAVPKYTQLIKGLAARGELSSHSWNMTYVQDRQHVQEYTPTSIPGMYSLRNVRPDDPVEAKKWAEASGLIFEWKPIVFFTADGNGFFVRKDAAGQGPDNWIVYDKASGGYKNGEAARPYIQQMLTTIDVNGLPKVGRDRPTFILYTSPSCPYSAKVEPLLEKSKLSYRIFPTYTINPGGDLPDVHRIFCSSDKIATWKAALRRNAAKQSMKGNPSTWWCSPTVMPVLELADLEFIFGHGYSTPSYYFADGSVISGADKLEQVEAKSKEMAARGLYFK